MKQITKEEFARQLRRLADKIECGREYSTLLLAINEDEVFRVMRKALEGKRST